MGHGIGTTVNELPWFVPSDETILEAGMVVCIETGAYGDEATGKCEKTFVIRGRAAKRISFRTSSAGGS